MLLSEHLLSTCSKIDCGSASAQLTDIVDKLAAAVNTLQDIVAANNITNNNLRPGITANNNNNRNSNLRSRQGIVAKNNNNLRPGIIPKNNN